MRIKTKILSLSILLFVKTSFAQTLAIKNATLKKVFDSIVDAYGNAKAPPAFELIPQKKSEGYPASYMSTPVPVVKIEEQVFDICIQMKADSLNALAIIISHELAHYYNDHTWCTDFAYAMNSLPLRDSIRKQAKKDQLTYEIQADKNSFYYSCIAGYAPFGIYSKLIDKIYTVYKLPAVVKGYPGKEERKTISKQAQKQIRQLYPIYDAGLLLLYLNYLPEAESCFDYLAKYFPSREIYNNLGIAKFLNALALKPHDAINFIYPIDIDPVTRIDQNGTRSPADNSGKYVSILKDAKKQFEKALSLDPSYISSHINLACVYDALENFDMANGNLNEAELLTADKIKLNHLRAIVQYHSGNKDSAEIILGSIEQQDSLAAFNYRLLMIAKSKKNNDAGLANYRDQYVEYLKNKTTGTNNCHVGSDTITGGKKAETKINTALTITSETIGNNLQIKISLPNKIINALIIIEKRTDKELNTGNIEFIDPNYGCIVFTNSITKTLKYKVK